MLYKTYSDEYFAIIVQKSKVPGWGPIGYKQTDHINTREKGCDAGEVMLGKHYKRRALECVILEGGRAGGEKSCDNVRDAPAK